MLENQHCLDSHSFGPPIATLLLAGVYLGALLPFESHHLSSLAGRTVSFLANGRSFFVIQSVTNVNCTSSAPSANFTKS